MQRIASDIGRRIEDEIWFEYEQRRLDSDDAAQMRKEPTQVQTLITENVVPKQLQEAASKQA